MRQERDKLEYFAEKEAMYIYIEEDVEKLKEKLTNLEIDQDRIMKQRDEDAEMTKSELEKMKRQMKLINMATLKRITGVYNSVTKTREQQDRGTQIH